MLPSTPRLSNCLFPPGLHTKTVCSLLSPILATCPASLFILDLIARIIYGGKYRALSCSLRSLLHSPVTSSLLRPNIHNSILFSDTLILHSSLNVSDQLSHSYERTSKFTVLYILMFIFLDSKLEDKRFCNE